MKQGKSEREKEIKTFGADFYEDYEYSKKLLGTVSGAGEVRLISIIDVCSESLSLFKSPFSLVQITTDTSVTD